MKSTPALLVQEGSSATLRRSLPVLLLATGFLLSSTAMFAGSYLLARLFGMHEVPAGVRIVIAAVCCAAFLALDSWAVLRNRQQSYGWMRQTPKWLAYRRGPRIGPFVWGLDTGLSFTTVRMSAATWAALILAILNVAPVWSGLAYGAGFTVPLAAAILVPPWRPDQADGTRQEPRWIPRLLQHRIRLMQACALVVLAGTTAVLLSGLGVNA